MQIEPGILLKKQKAVMNRQNDFAGSMPSISVILPALNEELNLEPLVNEIVDYFKINDIKYEIIIVDDGSTDNTYGTAKKLASTNENITVIQHHQTQGYGKSLRDGFESGNSDYLFYTDADRQFNIKSLNQFLPFIKNGDADMVIGYRINRKDSLLRKFLAWCYNKIICFLFTLHYKDIDCAFKLFKRETYQSLDIKSSDFLIDAELLAKARLQKVSITQLGVKHYPRSQGKSTVSYRYIILTLIRLFPLYHEIRELKNKQIVL
jgi:glycosyltransferase involved in cell wall biosynthesis